MRLLLGGSEFRPPRIDPAKPSNIEIPWENRYFELRFFRKVQHTYECASMPSSQLTLPLNDRIAAAAHKLAVRFTEDADLPARFRRQTGDSVKPRKIKEDSEIENRFRSKVDSWARLIETMISKIDQRQAWRFIHLLPQIDGTISKITENNDFCDFIDYLILRRDTEKCESDELGGLALLSVAFQREIEKRIPA